MRTLPTLLLWAALAASLIPSAARAADPVGPTVLLDERSSFERVLVIDFDGMRYLRFGDHNGDDQSVLDLARPDVPVLEYIVRTAFGAALAETLERGLVLGLGAGSVTRFWAGLFPEMHVDSVEIDPVVTAAAFQLFGFPSVPRLPVHVTDGRAFVRESRGDYDLALLDAFGAGDAPYHLTTLEFYRELRERMAPGGVVIANMVAERDATLLAQARTFHEAFPTVYRLVTPSDGNVLLVGTDTPVLDDAALRARLDAFTARHAPGTDLAAVAVPAPSPPGMAGAAVLHDIADTIR